MIDPKLLTRENGFEDGVVFSFVVDAEERLHHWSDKCLTWGVIERAERIRPLTGPMSIWNHAPGRAKSVIVTDLGDIIWYEDTDPKLELGGVVFHGDRPFWAVREDTKEKQG